MDHARPRRVQTSKSVFPIGPLRKQTPNVVSKSLLAVDRRCMSWLDQQKPKSVVYVSFGSLACMDPKQLVETAWGLANSGKPFLWVLRPGFVVGSGRAEVPEGFEEATRGRGLVVESTHSGWNSTLESVCEGVPMLCWSCFGDQRVNSRLVSSEWVLGLLLEGGLEREGIERDVKRLMGGGEGEKVREMKGLAEECVRVGGSSWGQ
ncbi:UDP-glycosyltransferase 76E2 [Acorus calamus]|uniref:UDP-glycosyltransferase 76E2 n=1 Tax=Acorus calamus TaxID=4465 RepID=A0AAV9FKY5_ACOCL|nr:UDP-glycosyltransferase 76E2 [Acorus calamus]